MWSLPSAPLFSRLAAGLVAGGVLFGVADGLTLISDDGHEVHAENQAEHVTPLFRRAKNAVHAGQGNQDGQMKFEVGVHSQRMVDKHFQKVMDVNLTTPLEDMTSEYIGHIGVGTGPDGGPQFRARVVFDTGSTNLWVASVLCHEYPCTDEKAKRFYDPSKSVTQESYVKTGVNTGKDIDIIFGTGELRGPLHVDTYRVGPMVVKKQPFAMIREMTGTVFSSFPFEGILGLGFRSLSFGGIEPFFERVIDQKLLKSNEFSFYLNAESAQPSAILWGGVDKSLYQGPIRMFPVVQPHYWALDLVDFRIGNQSLAGEGSKRVRRLIIDSGTTYFTAPSQLYRQITRRLVPTSCAEVEKDTTRYAPLVFVIRGKDGKTFDLEVTQETYMLGDGSQGVGEENDEGRCRPAFMRLDVAKTYGPAMILGEVFMRSFFTVFSRGDGQVENAKVGFAKARVGAIPRNTGQPSLLQPADVAAEGDVLAEGAHIPSLPAPHRRAGSRLMRRELSAASI